MKRFAYAAFAALLLLGGCFGPHQPSAAEAILTGEHPLRKLATHVDAHDYAAGGYFLFAGSMSESAWTETSVTFAWRMNDGSYAISSLPLEQIRVRLDNSQTVPSIKFRWRPWDRSPRSPQTSALMRDFVEYAVITVREADWPSDITMPLNQPAAKPDQQQN